MHQTFLAPLSGILLPIDQVPDPVFAQKVLGDGISIDPTSQTLLAPCEGEVVQLHSAGHALTLRTESGLELMLHIGLDTVTLKGQGFRPLVGKGARVRAGQPLIEFDADQVARTATSLLTQMVVLNSESAVFSVRASQGKVVAGQDSILDVETVLSASQKSEGLPKSGVIKSEILKVMNPEGLHARPVAVLASAAKKFQAEVSLKRGENTANAKSIVSVMSLEVEHGDEVLFTADGPDAKEAVQELTNLLKDGLGEKAAASVPASEPLLEEARSTSNPDLVRGVGASHGLAVGQVVQLKHAEIPVQENAQDSSHEKSKLAVALESAKSQISALESRLSTEADSSKAAIFAAHQEILEDPDLLSKVEARITQGKTAAFGWKTTIQETSDKLSSLKNELLAARANDVRDVGRRVLKLLSGDDTEQALEFPENAILVAEDLTPSDTASLDRSRVLGFCTTTGGATSHVAILARSLGIPALAGVEKRVLEIPNGTSVILDGDKGELKLNPSEEEVSRIRGQQEKQAVRRRHDLQHAMEAAITSDGHRVEVVANIAGVMEADRAVTLGAEGVGLLRSEFLFMERQSAPSEEEQTEAYSRVARTLGQERPLIIRTLDVGGDKPLSYLPIAKEDNPFLGERGIRVALSRPDIFRTQLRAILRASSEGKILIMFPMVATLAELHAAKKILKEESESLGIKPAGVGIMVEVPSAAVLADRFAPHVDFFSIGTNDLTQYTLAMDRGHSKLASQVDGLDPAVLRLIHMTVRAAHDHGKWVGVCGGIASEAAAIPVLLGLGVDELSVSIPSIPAVKAQIRGLSRSECRKIAQEAMEKQTAVEVREVMAKLLAQKEQKA